MTYSEEQAVLLNTFFDNMYLRLWKKNFQSPVDDSEGILNSLELNIRGKCNLKCKYCYMQKYMDNLYPERIDNIGISLENVDKVIDWLIVEKLLPRGIDIFGGEAVSCSEYKRLFGSLYRFIHTLTIEQRKRFVISLPINVIFLEDRNYYDMLIEAQHTFIDLNVPVYFSISLDGKYCDPHSRPAYNPKFEYSDAFYGVVSNFCRDSAIRPHFHPMVARENIKYWKENFLWYIDFISKTYSCKSLEETITYLYLLEVRNWDWTDEELNYFSEFLTFLIDYLWDNLDKEIFYSHIVHDKTLNILSFFGMNSSSLSCGLQTNFTIRTGDLTTAPCHRLFYDIYISSYIKIREDKSFDFIPHHPYGHIVANATNFRNSVPCSKCEINTLCVGPCLGSNYEANKDMLITPDVVCKLEKIKIYTIISGFKNKGLLPRILTDLKKHTTGSHDYHKFMKRKYKQINFLSYMEELNGSE